MISTLVSPMSSRTFFRRGIPVRSSRGRTARRSARRRGSRASGSPLPARSASPPSRLRVLVGLEVGQAHDHRLRPEGGRNGGHPLGQPRQKTPSDRCNRRSALDLVAQALRHLRSFQHRLGMDADDVVDDEFDARQAHAGVGDAPGTRRPAPGCRRSWRSSPAAWGRSPEFLGRHLEVERRGRCSRYRLRRRRR
jgi:hypothetical protein